MIYDRYLRQYATLFQDTDRNMWNYEDGCVLIGLLAMYEATGDAFYFNALSRFTDRYIEDDGTIRKYDMQEYNLDFIPAGRVLFSAESPGFQKSAWFPLEERQTKRRIKTSRPGGCRQSLPVRYSCW